MSEQFVSSVINAVGEKDRVALDIGANHGIYTAMMSPKFKKVYAVEPHPDNLAIIKKNLEEFKNIEYVSKAVSSSTGTIDLNVNTLNQGGHSINEAVAKHSEWGFTSKKITVDSISLDDLTKDLDVAFAKFDVEGAETFIFDKNATNFLKKEKLNIVVEVHKEVDMKKLYEIFKDNEFDIWGLGLVLNGSVHRLETIPVLKFHVDNHFLMSKQ